jgi:hypothetical protein
MALSPSEMHDAIIKNLPEKTGKNINQWLEIVNELKGFSNKEILNKLKVEYKIGHFQAQTILKCFNLKR